MHRARERGRDSGLLLVYKCKDDREVSSLRREKVRLAPCSSNRPKDRLTRDTKHNSQCEKGGRGRRGDPLMHSPDGAR